MGKFIRLKKGFTINLAGKASPKVTEVEPPETVSVKLSDFQGLNMPKLLVKEGDSVLIYQLLEKTSAWFQFMKIFGFLKIKLKKFAS